MKHRRFRVLDDLFRQLRLRIAECEPDRGGQKDLAVVEGDRGADGLADGLGESGDAGGVLLGHQDQAELVAGKPCQCVLRVEDAREPPRRVPTESLACLKRSRSITIKVGRRFGMVLAKLATAPRRSMNNLRFGKPVRLSCTESCSRRSSAFLVSVTSVSVPTTRETSPSEPTTGRAFSANHMKWPSGVRNRKSCTKRPRRWSSTLSSGARKRS